MDILHVQNAQIYSSDPIFFVSRASPIKSIYLGNFALVVWNSVYCGLCLEASGNVNIFSSFTTLIVDEMPLS